MKKNELPTMPAWMRTRVEATVQQQLNTAPVRKNLFMKKAALILAAAMLSGTLAAGAAQLMRFSVQQPGKYSVDIQYSAETAAPDTLPDVQLTAGWLPEGMVQQSERIEYADQPYEGGIAWQFLLLDSTDDPLTQRYITECEQFTLNGHDAVRLLRDNRFSNPNGVTFDQRIFIAYPEYQRMLELAIADNVPQADVQRIIENLTVTKSDATVKTADLYKWSQRLASEQPEISADDVVGVSEDNVFAIGKTVPYADIKNVTVTVESVQLMDDLDCLTGAPLPEEWQNLAGKPLPENIRTHWQSGNGVDTLDERLSEETTGTKLVYAAVRYTNTGAEPIEKLLFYAELAQPIFDGKQLHLNSASAPNADGQYITDSIPATSYMAWYDVQLTDGSENGHNYISALAPGESAVVHMAWLLPEPDISASYIDLNPYGSWYQDNTFPTIVKVQP